MNGKGSGAPAYGLGSLLTWPFEQANAHLVSGWGFWVGLVGVVFTAAGFGITWWQLWQTKSAVEAAKEEAKRIEASIKRYDAAQDAARANHALNSARRHFNDDAWEVGSEYYDEFRRALLSIKQNVKSIDVELGKRIDQATSFILKFCERVDRGEMKSVDPSSKAKAKTMLRRHEELLMDISTLIHKDVF